LNREAAGVSLPLFGGIMFQFIGKMVQNGDNPNSVGKVICETGPGFNKQRRRLTIEVSKVGGVGKMVAIEVYSFPDNSGRYAKVSGKGYIKILEGK
jgi:hypothetical protein